MVDISTSLKEIVYMHACNKTETAELVADPLALKLQRVYRNYATKPGGVLVFFKSHRAMQQHEDENQTHLPFGSFATKTFAKSG